MPAPSRTPGAGRPDGSAAPAPPPEAVGPLMRGLEVLRVLTAAGGRSGLGDLVRATGLARSTVDRIAATLVRIGYARLEGRDVVLTPRLMELGNAYLSATGIPQRYAPLADALAGTLDESVSLAVPDGDGVRFVHQAIRRRTMSLAFRIGDRIPAERAAAGALFAADWTDAEFAAWQARAADDPLDAGFPAVPPPKSSAARDTFRARADAARSSGVSVDDQLVEPGLVAVAVPVRDAGGRTVCALSTVSHTSRHTAESLRAATAAALRDTAEAMAASAANPVAGSDTSRPTTGRPLPRAAWLRASKQELGPEFVESFARGLAVVTAFDAAGGAPEAPGTSGASAPWRELPVALPLTAVAEATGLPRATARRALITLEHLGYAEQQDGLFRLTPRVLDLGFAHLSGLPLSAIAEPHLAALVGRVHESASMAVLSGDDVQYIARVPTVRIMSVAITVGTRFPAYATSFGRVLLAALPERERDAWLDRVEPVALTPHTVTAKPALAALLDAAAADGFSVVDGELEEGLRSVAAPVRDAAGRVVAAVNVAMHAGRYTPAETEADLLPPLREAAAAISADLAAASRYVGVEPR
ncbi:IclR family transcriptional regulator domain-containing protein [Yinghuangia soli]|uniref:Helix-turn-helix domain-containing protein n=1 Tax=Yinghuangia soli TaxID=2908204 RepID=A0AA41U7L5_9ACTN|nr:IclR family transcriptional regulator C-terminal domain-containing protein [Yinghuangia soli]MCF2532064.1 helix-turn-helix domain-containing protein [Yinghuangia soli]